ncbi:FG-GAP repeat domain-containing protein [Tahibacter harae]|uniref:VCBS repeat-containing protein n=1 Tax=Tahibacter harae TaxID=2963937 RepID=A0ABT1QYG6_9GAMM|nr:VCBS repeat-containing protein [Tahibacter harae]MCQ4167335.1 VCBS repeat-containing protein [Tahibacter harae]
MTDFPPFHRSPHCARAHRAVPRRAGTGRTPQQSLIPLALGAAVLLLAATPLRAAVPAPLPKWSYAGCSAGDCQTGWYASPAAGDIDGDGQAEVVWGGQNIAAYTGSTGAQEWQQAGSGRIWPAIGLADLDGDGTLEIVVGRNGNQLTVYAGNGTTRSGWPKSPFSGGEVRTLALEDLENDGDLEIIVGRASSGGDRQVSVYEHNGTVRPGWPARRTGEPGFGAGMYNENIAVADLDNDGAKEIYAPTDTHYITALAPNGDQLRTNAVYGLSAGQLKTWAQVGVHVDQAADLQGFANCGTQHRPNFANAAPAVADLDGDGTLELVFPGDVYNCAIGDPDGDLYYLPWILRRDRTRWAGSGFDWTVLPPPGASGAALSQDFSVIESSVSNAALADLDGDGRKEILFASYDGKLHAWWLDKTEKHSWPYDVPGSGIRFAAEPVVADLDNDGCAEVLFTSYPEKRDNLVGQLHVLNCRGESLQALNLPAPRGDNWNGGLGAPTLANLDADPDLEIVAGTAQSGLVAWDLPGSATARVLWGTGRGSQRRTGMAVVVSERIFADGFE